MQRIKPLFIPLPLLLCVSVFVAMGCDSKQGNSALSEGGEKVILQLNWKPEPQFGGFYAAKYDTHGLDVTVREGGVGTPTVQMVATGQVPFGVVSADEVVLNRAQGGDVIALFAVYQTNPQGLMTHAARGFDDIGAIFRNEGTLAMQQGLPYANFLKNKYGFDKVRVVPSPGGDLTVFNNDPQYAMQCFVTSEPLAAKRAGLDPQTFLIADAGYNPYTTVLATNGKYLSEHRDGVDAMIAAVRQGWADYLADPKPANVAMQRLNPTMDAQTFADSAQAQLPLIIGNDDQSIGQMTLERWQTLCQQLADLKVVKSAPDPKSCFLDDVHPATQP